jgi:hypothetical protein
MRDVKVKLIRTKDVKLLTANLNKVAQSEANEIFPRGSKKLFLKNISLLFVG